MAVATLQFGQCGNQVGLELFSTIFRDMESSKTGVSLQHHNEYFNQCTKQWFEEDTEGSNLSARAILVDTENKVISDILRRQSAHSLWKYDANNTIIKSGGAGNNWALGYQKKGPELYESVSESLRLLAERTDRLTCLLSLMSSAGGTGSGVGSYVVESLHDEYPRKVFLNAVVLPYEEGEVVIQSYNTMLTLAKLNNVSDATILFQNGHLHKMLLTLLNFKSVSIEDLNSLISLKLAGLFQPHGTMSSSSRLSVSDIVCHVASHPAYKFFSVKSIPHIPKESKKFEVSYNWPNITRHLKQMLRKNSMNPTEASMDWEFKPLSSFPASVHSLQQYCPSVANLLLTRGGASNWSEPFMNTDFQDAAMYPSWIPPDAGFLHCHEGRRFHDLDKFAVLAANNSQIASPLNVIVEKAWRMFTHKAYLHQYTRYGLMEEDFVDSFVKTESVIKAYKDLKTHS